MTPRTQRHVERWRGCRRLEPLASGVTESELTLGERGEGSQVVGNTRAGSREGSPVSPRLAGVLGPFGIPLVSSSRGAAAGLERLLTVREVASTLGVATSTVYQLCALGKLPHVRICNAIRIESIAVSKFVATSQREKEHKRAEKIDNGGRVQQSNRSDDIRVLRS